MAVKQDIFRRLDAGTKPGCILATNTSTLDIDAIASATSRPGDVIGLHFFSPANVMRLVEIVRGRDTAPATVAAALALAKKLGKVGVVVGNGFGFVGNRLMLPYMYEAQFLAEEGAAPQQVDKVLTDFGMAMGIFAVDDMAGLDVAWRVRQEHPPFAAGMRQPLVADVLCEMGRFGQKTGAGWYRYAEDRKAVPDPEVEALIERRAREAGITRRAVADAEILDRLLLTLVNEGARVLEEGIALARLRHRRDLPDRLRVPRLPGRPDVLCRPARPGRGVSARVGTPRASTARVGSRRRCSSAWRVRARPSASSTPRAHTEISMATGRPGSRAPRSRGQGRRDRGPPARRHHLPAQSQSARARIRSR